jgi:hypothetical protein
VPSTLLPRRGSPQTADAPAACQGGAKGQKRASFLKPTHQSNDGLDRHIAVPRGATDAGRHQIQAATEVRIIFGTWSLGLVQQNALGSEIRNAIGRCCDHLPPLSADILIPSEDPDLAIAGLQKHFQPPYGFPFVGHPNAMDIIREVAPPLARRAAHPRRVMSVTNECVCKDRPIGLQYRDLDIFVHARLLAPPHVQRPTASNVPWYFDIAELLNDFSDAPRGETFVTAGVRKSS